MHDDIRPPWGPIKQNGIEPRLGEEGLNGDSLLVGASSTPGVDEQKIAEEFGPSPTQATASISQLPSVIPTDVADELGPVLPPIEPTVKKVPRRSKKLLIILIVIAAVVALGGSAIAFFILRSYKPAQPVIAVVIPKPKPKPPVLVASRLTGLLVDPSVNERPVTAVMIENSIDARPQSGLDQAGIVFEALAEGGVTRFMALYQDTTADYIGPVRSARPYYLQWLLGFDAAYAHVGGSPDALSDITAWGVKDMNQFYNAGTYDRISSRYAPHNVYTASDRLAALELQKGFGKSTYTGFTRKKDEPSKTPTAVSVDIKFSGPYYDTHYDYDATTNTYKRVLDGAPHTELHKDGVSAQIAPKVVVAMVVPAHNGALDSSGAYYTDYTAVGSGAVQVFQDGLVTVGTWSKADNKSPLEFKDANGQPLALNAGQTWIAATPLVGNISYK